MARRTEPRLADAPPTGTAAASPPADGRARPGGAGSSQRERSPGRNSRNYDERSRF